MMSLCAVELQFPFLEVTGSKCSIMAMPRASFAKVRVEELE